MHIRDERAFRLAESLYPLILGSDGFVAEMDLRILDLTFTGPTYNMESFFRPKVYARIETQLMRSFHLDIRRYAHLHPLMIMSAITQTILSNDHAVSLDEHLWSFGAHHQINMSGLETAEEQMKLLHAIPVSPLYKNIKDISRSPQALRAFTHRSIRYYLEGDIYSLYTLTKASMHQLRRAVIYERNRRMAARIHMYDRHKSNFIAVGAGHLSGRFGLIALLRQKGWGVTPYTWRH